MKKTVIKTSILIVCFILAMIGWSTLLNQGNQSLTMEIAEPTLPTIAFEKGQVRYNELHGYLTEMDITYQKETITELGENRELSFVIENISEDIVDIYLEVRSTDKSRLVENTKVTEFTEEKGSIYVETSVKDLIEQDKEYVLIVNLTDAADRKIRYYTRIVWPQEARYGSEKLAFVYDFHTKTFDKEAAKELTKYLESSSKGDSSSFHKVNIYSKYSQVTWGDLNIVETMEPVIYLKSLEKETASFHLATMVATVDGRDTDYYLVDEYYRIRYTTDRVYLLDFERSMTQIPKFDTSLFGNDKILLGIDGEDVPMMESEDGNIVVFEVANKLCSYNVSAGKLAVLFSFYDDENTDNRAIYAGHGIKILSVDEGGNTEFAVYGYMNRGRHEGKVGVQLYHYDSAHNTIEEIIYIPYDKSYEILENDLEKLMYLDRDGNLYMYLDHTIYEVKVEEKTCNVLATVQEDDAIEISEDHDIIVWHHENSLRLVNLRTDEEITIAATTTEEIRPLGFMGEDVIYGIARKEDIAYDEVGHSIFPMYKVCISNTTGRLLKEYMQENYYVVGCTIEENQISLERVYRNEKGVFEETTKEHIMNNAETDVTKNKIVPVTVDIYEKIIQIQVKETIDAKSVQFLTPKEVVFEGARDTLLTGASQQVCYYVYDKSGVVGSYLQAGDAVAAAYKSAGNVMNENGEIIWLRGNRVLKNQIMAITESKVTEQKNSLAVCLDTILKYKGVPRNTEDALNAGKTAIEILQESLPNVEVVDLTGCPLDAMLYFTNRDIPVLATLNSGEAILITGFNQYQVVIMEPETGRLYKKGMNDTAEWLEENGNRFIAYFE